MKNKKVVSKPRPLVTKPASLRIDPSYKHFLHEIKIKIRTAQLQAAMAVNQVLLQFYWEIGSLIIKKQETARWGDKLLDALADDLKHSFPDMDGFSKPNLKNMRLFAETYPQFEMGQAVPSQLPWTHQVTLLRAVKSDEQRAWYATQAIENGWSYRQLMAHIKEGLYKRQGSTTLKTTNFTKQLPAPQSLLAEETLKDPYKFHFLTLGQDAHEKEVEKGLIAHITQFMLELGQGFAFVGNQYQLVVEKREFRLDLLFYHLKLRSYFVIEIKRGEFKPEYAGKLNFYLSAVDDLLKLPQDNPTIGLLLCEKKNKVFAEYALRDINKPMGISEYQLAKALPKKLQASLPTTEEIEAELNMDLDTFEEDK